MHAGAGRTRVPGQRAGRGAWDGRVLEEVTGDEIVQVLVNLLDNAIKYSAPDTPIEVRVRATDDRLEIAVADRGIGIPPEDLPRVFGKVYRVQHPGSGRGTGLGLSICKGIVEAHGGSIWAENRSGGGTILDVTLPLSQSVRNGVTA